MPHRGAAELVALVALVLSAACSGPDTTCTCSVLNNTERKAIACGESACVGGSVFACTAQDQATRQNACTQGAASGSIDSGAGISSPNPPDHSCDDLGSFCSTSCNSPASVAADCSGTASAGDPAACAAWQLSNGALCRP